MTAREYMRRIDELQRAKDAQGLIDLYNTWGEAIWPKLSERQRHDSQICLRWAATIIDLRNMQAAREAAQAGDPSQREDEPAG